MPKPNPSPLLMTMHAAADVVVGEDVESVVKEFTALLLVKGYPRGVNNGGVPYKYPRYLKKLFELGCFSCRSDIFLEGARIRAMEAFENMSLQMTKNGGQKCGKAHLVSNHMRGFDEFLSVADKSGYLADWLSLDDIADLL